VNVRYTSMRPADRPPTSTDKRTNFWMRALDDSARSAPPGIAEFLAWEDESIRS
jgi:hypothetical protein